ncbi:MAG: ROK family transcriptional regulator [Anaerolineae bacterium]|nr:ROK family transcriptional regulator [Anaerolineae bacterium]
MERPSSLSVVLNEIRQAGPISRIDLARRIGLSSAAISKLTGRLLSADLIREVGFSPSTVGRRPILLALNGDAYHVVGLDLSWQGLRGAIVNLGGHILVDRKVACNLFEEESEAEIVGALASLVEELVAASGLERDRLLGVGLVAPGAVSWHQGRMVAPTPPTMSITHNIRRRPPFDWSHIALAEEQQERTGLPTYVDNNANAAAVAETWFGEHRGAKNLAYVAVGGGIGAGLIVNGEPYRGDRGLVAEIGHTTVQFDGPPCRCGNVGCLELYASTVALLDDARRLLAEADTETLGGLAAWKDRPEQLTAEDVYQCAHQGSPGCQELVARQAAYLGTGIVNLVNMMGCNLVVLGSRELSLPMLDGLCARVTEIVRERAYASAARFVEICPSHLGADAFILGAATLVLHPFFAAPEAVMRPAEAH